MRINKDSQLCISLAARPSNFGTRFHNYLYQALDLNFIYKAFSTGDIEHAIKGVRALGIRGCAVSMPFKESCMPFLDELSASAQAINSVNTIVNNEGRLKAYNTDYIAIVKLIEQYCLSPQTRVLVHGSGGMAKAVVAAFRDSGFTQLQVYARNREIGAQLAASYGYGYIGISENATADILVNVTPIGMAGSKEVAALSFPETLIAQAQTVFDVVALPSTTPLIKYATTQGIQTISGAEVAVLQALEQFVLYTGQRPSESLVAEAAAFARAG